jgi:ABC-type Mn2+/Zn2+ transport system permease subunit
VGRPDRAALARATSLLFGSIVGVSDGRLRDLGIVAAIVVAGLAALYRPLLVSRSRSSSCSR